MDGTALRVVASLDRVVGWQDPPRAAPARPAPAQPDGDTFAEDSALLGQTLGERYRIEQRIGCGGMGVVYRASHLAIERTLAVKVLRLRYARHEDIAARFAQEAQVASRIKHPNVVDIIDYGTAAAGTPYFVMEYLSGHSLAHEIDHFGELEPRRALGIAMQITQGLAIAHKNGIVHRDLKPDNIYLCPGPDDTEIVKLLDFGIARILGASPRLTAEGSVVGTPEYMSPEQAQGEEVDGRSDLYALGVILFEMLTGSVPFRADSLVGVLTKQVYDAPPELRVIAPKLAALPSVERVLTQLLRKNVAERPETAVDVQSLLGAALVADLGPPSVEGGAAEASAKPGGAARPTIAIGSGSVGDSAQAAGVFEVPVVRRGPQMRPPSHASSLQSLGARAADGEGGGAGAPPPGVVVRADTPSLTIPPKGAEPQLAQGGGADRSGPPVRAPARGGAAPLILLGVGAAIFAGFVTVGVVNWVHQRRATAGEMTPDLRDDPVEDVRSRDLDGAAGPAAPNDEGRDEVNGTEGAMGATSAPDLSPELSPMESRGTQDVPSGTGTSSPSAETDAGSGARPGETSGAKRGARRDEKRGEKRGARSGSSIDKGSGEGPAVAAETPAETPAETSADTKKNPDVKEPPAAPDVSLQDLKDPFR